MRSIFLGAALLILLIAPLSAQEQGFIGPGTDTNMVKVADLGSLQNYSQVMLTGTVEKKLDDRLYQFQDGSGTVNLVVDDDLWSGLTVTPNDLVEIQGELDLNASGGPRVEVNQLAKVNRVFLEETQPGPVVK